MSATSPTQLSLKRLRDNGYTVAVVEHWNPFVKIRQDLFGFIDILAVKPGRTLAIQATSADNAPTRVNKIKAHPNLAVVLAAGWEVRVWGWDKPKNRWRLQRDVLILNPVAPQEHSDA